MEDRRVAAFSVKLKIIMTAPGLELELVRHLHRLPVEKQREVVDFAAKLRAQREAELEAAVKEMAADEEANAEALEWCEGLIEDIYNETP